MGEPSFEAQQCAVHMIFGVIPVLRVRQSELTYYGSWRWGRWRMAAVSEVVVINTLLMKLWRK